MNPKAGGGWPAEPLEKGKEAEGLLIWTQGTVGQAHLCCLATLKMGFMASFCREPATLVTKKDRRKTRTCKSCLCFGLQGNTSLGLLAQMLPGAAIYPQIYFFT